MRTQNKFIIVLTSAIFTFGLVSCRIGTDGNGDLSKKDFYGRWGCNLGLSSFDIKKSSLTMYIFGVGITYPIEEWIPIKNAEDENYSNGYEMVLQDPSTKFSIRYSFFRNNTDKDKLSFMFTECERIEE